MKPKLITTRNGSHGSQVPGGEPTHQRRKYDPELPAVKNILKESVQFCLWGTSVQFLQDHDLAVLVDGVNSCFL